MATLKLTLEYEGTNFAGWAAQNLGWRAAMYLPAAVLAAAGVFMLLCLREAPQLPDPPPEAGLPTVPAGSAPVYAAAAAEQ